jgi:hypothetical protein
MQYKNTLSLYIMWNNTSIGSTIRILHVYISSPSTCPELDEILTTLFLFTNNASQSNRPSNMLVG